jgi:hypothetical protein
VRAMLCGPIEYWWDENWETDEHWHYVAWRDAVSVALVDAGHLVYRPHEAFKGAWDANDGDSFGQLVNDAALIACNVILDLSPPGIPSEGTEAELKLCAERGKPVVPAPPPIWRDDFPLALGELVRTLARLTERG